MLRFDTEKDAVEWGKANLQSKYERQPCMVGDQRIILCSTPLAIEDDFNTLVSELEQKYVTMFPNEDNGGYYPGEFDIDEQSELFEKMQEYLEHGVNAKIVYVYTEY